MAIKTRRGNYLDFDPNKLVAGELAMILNHGTPRGNYILLLPGNTRLASAELQALLYAYSITINSDN